MFTVGYTERGEDRTKVRTHYAAVGAHAYASAKFNKKHLVYEMNRADARAFAKARQTDGSDGGAFVYFVVDLREEKLRREYAERTGFKVMSRQVDHQGKSTEWSWDNRCVYETRAAARKYAAGQRKLYDKGGEQTWQFSCVWQFKVVRA